MPEMSSYYYAWMAANNTQATGLIQLFAATLAMCASHYAVPVLPKRWHTAARRALESITAAGLAVLAYALWISGGK